VSEGAITRCILESLALKYREVLSRLEEATGNAIEVIHMSAADRATSC